MYLRETKFCAIDVETTGLDIRHDELISFACVPIQDLKILVGQSYYTLILPKRHELEAMKYHGISQKDLETAPTFHEVAHRIMETTDGILVGHSVEFDYAFLRRHFKDQGIEFKRDILDIILIEKWLGRKCGRMGEDLTLEAMMSRYGLKESYRHNALADAFFVAQILQLELLKLSDLGIDSVKKLNKIVKSCRYALW
jgi:DNA polymerase III subunit epsilon